MKLNTISRSKSLIYECIRQNTGFNSKTGKSDIMPVYTTNFQFKRVISNLKRDNSYKYVGVIYFSLLAEDKRHYLTAYAFYNLKTRKLEFIIGEVN